MYSCGCHQQKVIGMLGWKPFASQISINFMTRTLRLPNSGYVIGGTMYSKVAISRVKNIHPCTSPFSTSMGPYYGNVMHNPGETPESGETCKAQANSDTLEKPILTENTQADNSAPETSNCVHDKELERRRKIGHGNKGKVPWNKGRKHSEETRQRIRQRTKEALKNPKVRKKMSECPRFLSKQTKERIRSSLTKLWSKKLKWKRSRENFLQSWAYSIAKAAKIGGGDQQELDWDSYDKIKREIAVLQFHQAAERIKAKEMARIRAARAAEEKAKKMERIAQKRKEKEEKAKIRGESIRKRNRRSKEEREKLAEFQEVKLKERLMKIHRKKSTISQVNNHPRSWEKLDLDIPKGEQTQQQISLADQIRLAKNKRAGQLLDKILTP